MRLSAGLEKRPRALRLSGMASTLPARLLQADQGDLSAREFLELLVEDEPAVRKGRRLARRLKKAKLPCVKYLSDFDFAFNPKIPKRLVLKLNTARFVREKRGVLLIGAGGAGKSRIAISLAVSAIAAGHTVLHESTFDPVAKMAEA